MCKIPDSNNSCIYKLLNNFNCRPLRDTHCSHFDIILFGKQSFDMQSKKASKTFLKEFDGEFPAKDSLGYLDDLPDEFPNDLGLVVAEIAKRYQ